MTCGVVNDGSRWNFFFSQPRFSLTYSALLSTTSSVRQSMLYCIFSSTVYQGSVSCSLVTEKGYGVPSLQKALTYLTNTRECLSTILRPGHSRGGPGPYQSPSDRRVYSFPSETTRKQGTHDSTCVRKYVNIGYYLR